MGRSVAESGRDGLPATPCSAALGPSLYDGSAGVSLFLAQLYALTGEPAFRKTALGGIARSWRHLDGVPETDSSRVSFFNGPLGVAFAAERIAALTAQEGDHGARVEAVLDRVAVAAAGPHLLDLIGGNAGAIPALLVLGRTAAPQKALGIAVSLGEELCRKADRRQVLRSGPGTRTRPRGRTWGRTR